MTASARSLLGWLLVLAAAGALLFWGVALLWIGGGL